jgi:acyl transferase domain-containing protein
MEPIAIIGAGCILPGAQDPAALWRLVLEGRTALRRVPESAWDHSLYFAADKTLPDRTYGELGGFVDGFVFDWRRFKVPPADAQTVNPMQWMILEAGAQALGGVKRLPGRTTGVVIGSTGLGWQKDSGLRIRLDDMLDAVRSSEAFRMLPRRDQEALLEEAGRRLSARLKEVSEDNVVGASASVAAGRINMHFDLEGPHFAVDAGFASSLAALDLAVRALRDGELDLAVAGGASELLSPLEMIAFSKLGGLSPGMPRPFSADADGTVLGEGVGLLALKRLEDAERDGEQILGLVLGVGGSSDGRGKSLVAPRPEGQALAMRRALEDGGGLLPESVDFIECHATGTQVGDASELRALGQVYGGAREGRVALGSVKANLGHLRSAAGAAGLLKTVWALQHRTVPPQPSVQAVNPGFELERTPFQISSAAVALPQDRPVRGAVSSFSFGGNNFHAVLESYQKRARTKVRRPPAQEPLAIIGLGGMFPGADDVPTFWKRLLEGMDRTAQVPADRYDIERYVDPDGKRRDKSYTRVGCFMDALPPPDAAMRIPPSAFPSVDPSHVLCLRTAQEALQDAGWAAGRWAPDRVALSLAFLPYQGKKFLADSRVHWAELAQELGAALEAAGVPASDRALLLRGAEGRYKSGLPPITEDTLTGYMGSLNAGRITSLYDFRGPHFVVDAACASAHAAFGAAERMLRHRVADVVLAGGVWCDMMPEFFIAACRFNALSARGSFPFAEGADGFIPGEGAGMVVLKRLSDAERDGDRIRAVLRSVAGASDGKGRSVLAPSRKGEALAMRRTLESGGVDPHSVDYVECHGTGTALGDVVESNATWDAYGQGRNRPLAIGSVKSNIGHLNAAAGVAGLIKAALAVEQGVIPASLKCQNRNPSLPAEVEVVGENRPWPSGPDGGPRRAGVSSFGVGGANYHLVVEEYRPKPAKAEAPLPPDAAPVLLATSGPTATACADALAEQARRWALGEAPTGVPAPGEGSFRLAISARSADDAQKKLGLLRGALERGGAVDFLWQSGIFLADERSELSGAKVAFTFPGQGGQYPDMLRALGAHYPVVRETLGQADAIYQRLCGRTLTGSFFTDDPEGWRQRDEDIHAAVFVVNVALARQLRQLGIVPAVLVGQSAGELAALVVAQALSFEDGLCAILARTVAVLELQTPDPGRMAALGVGAEDVPALLEGLPGYATLAADNGPRACIVSADAVAQEALTRRCAEREVECTVLAVSHGYHSQLIAGAMPAYRQALEQLELRRPQEKIISTIDGRAYGERRPRDFPAYLASQFVEPVRLRQALQEAHRAGARVFLEVGPKWSLTQFTRESLRELPHAAMASIHPKVGELEQFQRLLGFCFVHRLGQPASPAPEVPMPTAAVPAPASSPHPAEGTDASLALFELPLAEVLGEASARRIATALGRRFGVDASSAAPRDVQSLEAVVSLVERLRAEPQAAQGAAPTSSATPRVDPAAASDEIHRALLAATVAKTGYPQEMLELDLDLEADLGIDTVKQVDIFATVRSEFGIPRDPKLSLRDFNTLRKVVEHLTEKWLALRPGQAPASPAPLAAPAPAAPPPEVPAVNVSPAPPTKDAIQAVLIQHAVEKTGYPAEMLELDLDLEADLGIDTVKQVDIFARTREAFGVERDPKMSLREFNTLRKVVDYLAQKVATRAPTATATAATAVTSALQAAAQPPPAPAPPDGGDGGSVRATLLGMNLDELGIGPAEVQKLARALAQRLGVPPPEPATARSLSQLVELFAARRATRP